MKPQRVSYRIDILFYKRDRQNRLKACRYTRRSRPKHSDSTVVIDLGLVPPVVVTAYHRCSYPFYAGLLPDQFMDHEGNLRNGQGAIIFAKRESSLPTREPADDPHVQGYTQWTTDSLVSTFPSMSDINISDPKGGPHDLSDFLTILEPDRTPKLANYKQVFKKGKLP